MGRCSLCTPIWSKDGRLCACGVCPRASPARARALRIPGLEGTGGVRGEIPRQSENSRLIPVEMANPWLTDAGAGGACVGRWTWLMPSGFKGAGSPWFELEEGNVLIVTSERESVLFIGTQFSNLYTAVDTSLLLQDLL